MLRLLFACLVSLTILVNPVIASAARAECDRQDTGVEATWPTDVSADMKSMPCCDHQKLPKSCAKICDLYQSMSVAVLPAKCEMRAFATYAPTQTPVANPVHCFEPGMLDPPPRGLA